MENPKKLSLAQNALLNSIGVIFYCLCQWLVTMFVARESYSNAGILQLSISITNIFYTISTYNLRTFQVSDLKNDYFSEDYIGARILTSSVALVLCLAYAVVTGNEWNVVLCIGCYMIFKLSEAIADVLHGINQKNYRMDYVAGSYIMRGLLSVALFAGILLLTHNILLAIVSMAIGGFVIVTIYDFRCTASLSSVTPHFDLKKLINLLWKCLPSVIASAAFVAITTVPRQYLEAMHDETTLGYYATVATPIVIIQVLATSIFNPILTDLAVFFDENNIKKFISLLGKTLLFILVFAVVGYIGCALLGEFALVLLYGESIRPYVYLMYAIIACTVLYAGCWLCANILIIMRRLVTHMTVSLICLALAVITGKLFIGKFYMNGVSFCIIMCYSLYIISELFIIIKTLKKKGRAS